MRRPSSLLRSLAVGFAAATALIAGQAGASNLPVPVLRGDYDLQQVGTGELRWLGRPVYRASLWTAAGAFRGYVPGEPVALSLSYERKFSRDELLQVTATAWRLMGSVPRSQRDRWLDSLRTVWSDVAPGDNVTTVVVPGRATRFYDRSRFMGQVDDPAFGPAFLAIWLDSRSVVGDLRVQLLGVDSSASR